MAARRKASLEGLRIGCIDCIEDGLQLTERFGEERPSPSRHGDNPRSNLAVGLSACARDFHDLWSVLFRRNSNVITF